MKSEEQIQFQIQELVAKNPKVNRMEWIEAFLTAGCSMAYYDAEDKEETNHRYYEMLKLFDAVSLAVMKTKNKVIEEGDVG